MNRKVQNGTTSSPSQTEVVQPLRHTPVSSAGSSAVIPQAHTSSSTPGVTRAEAGSQLSGPELADGDPRIQQFQLGGLVGIRFDPRVRRRRNYCLGTRPRAEVSSGRRDQANEPFASRGGSFPGACLPGTSDDRYNTFLPPDSNRVLIASTLCAGLTAYNAVTNAEANPAIGRVSLVLDMDWYAMAQGSGVSAVDGGGQQNVGFFTSSSVQFVDL
ncbi:hypothetical protein LTR91_006470 [Friedmanniomyces endolithicus]|uniref:Uncharacterized protein n=1 Tax=Friedmanniomyces endolithicus TaxID=329885 RepID=A0AAN6QVZ6_9PEZI|nr:hypothetical protein LTR91_006470 [Friedmanniomyces endolithicus]